MLEKIINSKYWLTKTFTRQLISKTVLQKYFKEGRIQITIVRLLKIFLMVELPLRFGTYNLRVQGLFSYSYTYLCEKGSLAHMTIKRKNMKRC